VHHTAESLCNTNRSYRRLWTRGRARFHSRRREGHIKSEWANYRTVYSYYTYIAKYIKPVSD